MPLLWHMTPYTSRNTGSDTAVALKTSLGQRNMTPHMTPHIAGHIATPYDSNHSLLGSGDRSVTLYFERHFK